MFVKKFTDARMAQHQEHDASRNRHEKQKEPRFYGHALLKPRDARHKWAGVDYEDEHHDQKRVYDRTHKDYHTWDDNENRYYHQYNAVKMHGQP